MAAEYPYVMATGRLATMFEKIEKQGQPAKADNKWLESLGFKSSNDRRFLSVLRYLGFTDGSSLPTTIWPQYRGSPRPVMAQAIRRSYSKLYERFGDAHTASNADLGQFIRVDADLADESATRAVHTFKALVGLADFANAPATTASASNETKPADDPEPTSQTAAPAGRSPGAGITVNVNLQLTLPESTDPAVYDALFSSLQRHVLSGESTRA